MVRSDSREDRSPLQRIIPIIVLIGTLGYITGWFLRGADSWVFLQIGAAGALLVYLLTFIDIVLGLGILIACVGFSPQISLGGVGHLRLEDFLTPALLMAWLLRSGQLRERLVPMRIGGPALAYFSALVLSTMLGLWAGTTTMQNAVELLGKYVEYFALFLLLVNNVRTEQEFKALAIFSVLVAMASAVFSSGAALVSPSLGSRVEGPLGETANIYGGYLVMNLSLALGFFLQSPTPGSRVASSVAVTMLVIPILHTYSRTSTVSIFLALLLFGLFRERRVILVLAMIAAVVPFIAPDSVLDRLSTVTGVLRGEQPPSWSSRMESWEEAVPRVLHGSPLTGFGAGSIARGWVDNEYVRVIVDGGILALGTFLWLLLRIVRIAFVRYGELRGPGFHKGFAAGYLIALFGICVHAVAATSFTAIRTGETFMILTGLYFCQVHRLKEWTARTALEPPPPLARPEPRPFG